MTVTEIFGEVVSINQLDGGTYILDVCTVEDTSIQQLIPESYYDKVCSKFIVEGTLVKIKLENRIIGKTSWKNKAGKDVIHGMDEAGKWKAGFETRKGEKTVAFSGINKISSRLFEKKEKELLKNAARKVVKASFDETGDAGFAQVLANIELS